MKDTAYQFGFPTWRKMLLYFSIIAALGFMTVVFQGKETRKSSIDNDTRTTSERTFESFAYYIK